MIFNAYVRYLFIKIKYILSVQGLSNTVLLLPRAVIVVPLSENLGNKYKLLLFHKEVQWHKARFYQLWHNIQNQNALLVELKKPSDKEFAIFLMIHSTHWTILPRHCGGLFEIFEDPCFQVFFFFRRRKIF